MLASIEFESSEVQSVELALIEFESSAEVQSVELATIEFELSAEV